MKTASTLPPTRVADSSEVLPRHRALFADAAAAEGFRRIGVTPIQKPPHWSEYERWIADGFHASMDYLDRSRPLRGNPASLLPGARSVIVLTHSYAAGDPTAPDGARTARYALATDYHRTLRDKCRRVIESVRRAGVVFSARICVDSAPLNERDFAAAAGVGWIGKNGMVLNREDGSFFYLCEIVTNLALPPDAPQTDHCGTCTRCLDACPTQAFIRPRVLDSARCLSYWTIEQRRVIPDAIVDRMSGWVFGCDACQEACPYNRPVPTAALERRPPTRRELLESGAAQWKRRFADTPLARAGAAGMRRNAAAAASSGGRRELLPTLEKLAQGAHAVVAEQARRACRALEGS